MNKSKIKLLYICFIVGLFVSGEVGAQVPYDRIVNATGEPENWLTYNGDYMSQRYYPG